MKKYNTLGIGLLFCFILIAVSFYFTFTVWSEKDFHNLHDVEINRAYHAVKDHGYGYIPDLSNYEYIQNITFIPTQTNAEETLFFFQEGDTFALRPFYENNTLIGYAKFTLVPHQLSYMNKVLQMVYILFAVLFVFLLSIFFFLKYQLIAPFQTIVDFPFALSKGVITAPIKVTKYRYFGQFIWGLNMLRETLEIHKKKELDLQREKKTLILSISHDIKTPLNAMKLYTKALKSNLYRTEEKRNKILDNIDQQSDKIESFVSDIIKASQEDFLNIEVVSTEFYLKEVISNLKEYYQDKLALLKTEFIIDTYHNHLLYGDLTRTIEVFQNVMENAIKYGDGTTIQLSFSEEDNCQLITIRNNGNTLPENELLKIFDSFWRGSNVKGQNGSGLGLYICKQILKQMQGEIYAQIQDTRMHVTIVLKKI